MRTAYSCPWAMFTAWCRSRHLGPLMAMTWNILAAIQAARDGSNALSADNHVLISHFPRGAQRFSAHRYVPPISLWDLDMVLGALQRPPF